MANGPLFEDNTKAWSGDHGVDPRIVPGVVFCNQDLHDDDPALIDIAPTALDLFGIKPPKHMDGKPLFERAKFEAPKKPAVDKKAKKRQKKTKAEDRDAA